MTQSNPFWSDLVHQLTPYVPGEQPKEDQLIKLNTNENPYPPSPKVLAAITQANNERLRLYPDPNGEALKQALADHFQLQSNQVFVGNGSDEVLAHTFQALLKHSQPILFPDITYSFYPVYCGLYQIDYQTVPLTDDFSIDPNDYTQPNGGIIFPNPNAPTGKLLPLTAIETILQANPQSVVVVDEAYIDFGGESAVRLIAHYPNLLVTQTFSKSRALAGLRIGYALGQADLIEALERVKNSFNSYPLDQLALVAGVASVEDHDYFEAQCQRIIVQRQQVTEALDTLGFDTLESYANFILTCPPAPLKAEALAQQLREKKIIVRYFNQPRIKDYLRITIGSESENQALIDAVKTLLEAH
ncbi:histidinol-phosphate transaminase [Galenea microaerophila]